MSDDLDREIARVKVDAATHRERQARRRAEIAHADWLRSRSQLDAHKYWRADLELTNSREALALSKSEMSALIEDEVA